jgi:hypothetical protein
MLSKDVHLSCMRQDLMLFEKVPSRTAPKEIKEIKGLKKVEKNGQT